MATVARGTLASAIAQDRAPDVRIGSARELAAESARIARTVARVRAPTRCEPRDLPTRAIAPESVNKVPIHLVRRTHEVESQAAREARIARYADARATDTARDLIRADQIMTDLAQVGRAVVLGVIDPDECPGLTEAFGQAYREAQAIRADLRESEIDLSRVIK